MSPTGKIIAALLLLIVLLHQHAPAEAGDQERRTITMTGKAEIQADPDTIVVYASAYNFGKKLEETYDANEQTIARVLDLAKKYSIPANQVTIGLLSVLPEYKTGSFRKNYVEGYGVTKQIIYQFKDFSKIAPFISDLFDAGVNRIERTEIKLKNERKTADEARLMAIRAAREKAASVAKELGLTLGDAIKIEEQKNDFDRLSGPMISTNFFQVTPTVMGLDFCSTAHGQVTVKAILTATFEMQKK